MSFMYKEYGVFKCLGCKHYLSGDNFGCEKNCPRTENGTEQIWCRLHDIEVELGSIEKAQLKLIKKRDELHLFLLGD